MQPSLALRVAVCVLAGTLLATGLGQPEAAAAPVPTDADAPACLNGATPHILSDAGDTAPLPPKSWHPLTSSAEDLATYGFPERPPAGEDAEWVELMRHWKGAVKPGKRWTCGPGAFVAAAATPARSARLVGGATNLNSPVWAGFSTNEGTHCKGTAGLYRWAGVQYKIPTVTIRSSPQAYSVVAIWAGVGTGTDYTDDAMPQAGTETGTNGTTKMWYMVFPQDLQATYVSPGFTTVTGNTFYVRTSFTQGVPGNPNIPSTASYYFYNVTKGLSATYYDSFNGFSGAAADWVVERKPGTHFGAWTPALQLSQAQASRAGTTVSAGQRNYCRYTLTLSGSALASATMGGSPYSTFTVTRTAVLSN